jgi:small subunit ribosomal protein S16
MSVHIRLARFGSKKSPFYRVVVADQRCSRDGRHIERLGTFNPSVTPEAFEVSRERYEHWKAAGAVPSATVEQLVKKHQRAQG